MIIQCEQCETTYRFDPARLYNPETGEKEAKVRCIRCGHIFRVHAGSDLSENFLSPEPAAAAPQQGIKHKDILPAPEEEPPADFSFAVAKETDTSLFTTPGEVSPEPSDTAPEPTSDSTQAAKEFVFESLQTQSHAPEPAPASEDEEKNLDIPEVSTPATAAKGDQKKKTSKLLLFILLLVLVCAGIYAYYFVVHGVTSVTQVISTIEGQINRAIDPHAEPRGTSIQIQTDDNFYINNNHLGSIFVINGTVTNTSEQPQGEIALVATLYSASGTALRSVKVYCGNPISKEILRTEPLDILQKHMDNKLGAELTNVSVQPGESIPFSVVFHDLPDSFAEFSLSAAPPAGAK